jgi:hypothetical protein
MGIERTRTRADRERRDERRARKLKQVRLRIGERAAQAARRTRPQRP